MIIFLYGEDTFRSRQKLNEIKDKFLKEVDPSGNSLVRLDGENFNLAKFNELAGSSSLFARRRMVIIERLFSIKNKEAISELAVYLNKNFSAKSKDKDLPKTNIILFWEAEIEEKMAKTDLFKFLNQQKFVYVFKRLSSTETIAWIKKEFAKRGVKISITAASQLAGLCSNDLWQINNEIDKIINYKMGAKTGNQELIINEADISVITQGSFNEGIFALTDAIGRRDKGKAAILFEKELTAGTDEINLLSLIIKQFRTLLLVRQCLDKSYSSRKIINVLKLHPFVVQKSLLQARNFQFFSLKQTLINLLAAEKAVKTGRQEAKTILSLLLAKI